MMNQEQKKVHNHNMLRIAAVAIEHALKSVELDEHTHKLIAERIKSVVGGHANVDQMNRERAERLRSAENLGTYVYTPASRLLDASEELVLLSKFGGYLTEQRLTVVLSPCWDSIGINNRQKEQDEITWQGRVLQKLINRAYQRQGEPLEIASVPEF